MKVKVCVDHADLKVGDLIRLSAKTEILYLSSEAGTTLIGSRKDSWAAESVMRVIAINEEQKNVTISTSIRRENAPTVLMIGFIQPESIEVPIDLQKPERQLELRKANGLVEPLTEVATRISNLGDED